MPANAQKSNQVQKQNKKRDSSWKGKSPRAREVRSPKMKKRKRGRSSEGLSEPSKQSEDEEETDDDAPASKYRDRRNRSHRGSGTVATASEVEEVGTQDDDIVELMSVDTKHDSESDNVSSHSAV
jgi:hypothetical protein